MSNEHGTLRQMKRLHPMQKVVDEPVHVIGTGFGLRAVAMPKQIQSVGGVSAFCEFGSQIVPIMKRGGNAMDHDNRHARRAALLDKIYCRGNVEIILLTVFHNALPI